MLKKNKLTNDYILVIPSWYPSRVDPFNGDFNERMVEAFSKRMRSLVLYVVADPALQKNKIDISTNEDFTVVTLYYKKSHIKLIASLVNFWRYLFYSYHLTSHCVKKYGKPIYIHCFVFFPAGLITWFFSKKFRIKHILTEHWTIFYENMPNSVQHKNRFIKLLIKKLLNSFSLIMPVADALKKQMITFSSDADFQVIPNVVDKSVFNYVDKNEDGPFIFVHVSTMGYQKNPQLLLAAFEIFFTNNDNSVLKLIGPINKEVTLAVKKSSLLMNHVEILGELDHKDVAMQMKKSHCFVLCSRFENLPCVILEALCCGLPVISSDVGGVSEVVDDSNGLLTEEGNVEQLLSSIINIYQGYERYNRTKISHDATNKFNYNAVDQLFLRTLTDYNII